MAAMPRILHSALRFIKLALPAELLAGLQGPVQLLDPLRG
jgi:hypothetical protein